MKTFGRAILILTGSLVIATVSPRAFSTTSPRVFSTTLEQDPRVQTLRRITAEATASSTLEERQSIKTRVHTILVTLNPNEKIELLSMMGTYIAQAELASQGHVDSAMGLAWTSILPLVGFTLASIDYKSAKHAMIARGLSVLSFALFSNAAYLNYSLRRNVAQLRQGIQELTEAMKNEARAIELQ